MAAINITLRTVSGESFQVEAPPTTTIAQLKALVEQQRGVAKESMKLVYKGQVLSNDDATVEAAGIESSGFVVLFVTKAPAVPAAPAPTAPAPAPAAAAAPVAAPAAEAAAAPAAPAVPDAPVAAPAAAAGAAAEAAALGAEYEPTVAMLCDMGFERSEVIRALRAAFYNAERAVEYLTTGFPAHAAPQNPAPAAAAAAAAGGGGGGAGGPAANVPFNMFGGPQPGAGGGGGGGALDFLRGSQQFQMLRHAVRANPGILTPMLQELGRSNHQLVQLIQSNQDDFLRILQEPGDDEDALGAMVGMEGGEGEEGEGEEGEEGEGEEGEGMAIELTEEDMEKVARLEQLGFPREACLEALIACDMNEELAANFMAEASFD